MLKRGEACTECRRRKLKCDGHKPTCTNCLRDIRECRYERPVTRPVYLVLQERLSQLEEKFRSLTTSSEQASARDALGPIFLQEPSGMSSLSPSVEHQQISWDKETVWEPIEDHLLKVFVQNHSQNYFHFHIPTFLARVASQDPREQPHPAFMHAIHLFGCYFSSELTPSHSFAYCEDYFLAKARQGMTESLSMSDRLMDFLRASILVTYYLFNRGRILEGYHVHCGAARFALSCGLHRLSSPVFRPDLPLPPTHNAVLLPPAANQVELGERIMTFWMIYVADKMYAIHCGYASALPSEYDQREPIETVFPREMEDYESGAVSDAESETLKTFVSARIDVTANAGYYRRPDTPYTQILKALTIQEMGVRLSSMACANAGVVNQVFAITQLETAAGRLLLSLPPASAILPPVEGSPPADIMAPMAQVVALISLTDVYHILGDVDNGRALEGRLAVAERLALLAHRFGELDLNPCMGYRWCIAAELLVQHIEHSETRTAPTDDYETHLATIMDVIGPLAILCPPQKTRYRNARRTLSLEYDSMEEEEE